MKSVLLGLIEPTRQESGCIQYELLQNHSDPTDFVFVEEWESEQLLYAHLESPHINEVDAVIGWIVSSTARDPTLPMRSVDGVGDSGNGRVGDRPTTFSSPTNPNHKP